MGLIAMLAFGGSSAAAARAEFGPIQLISKSAGEQAGEAFNPAISGNGEFVAFAGRIGGRKGIFRKDLASGALALVEQLGEFEIPTEARPSISADGRYVAFTTTRRLDPRDDLLLEGAEISMREQEGTSDVYVADMSTTPPTYELASAIDGCDPRTSEECGLTYRSAAGAVAAARVALSANGRKVAFLTRSESNLAGPETPAGQVAVRDLDRAQTFLETTEMGTTEPVPGGGADAGTAGAAISADGSAVAWVGRHLPGQVPMLPDEEAAVRGLEASESQPPEEREYHEPLWRELPNALQPDPPTRRVVGGGDPLAAGCPSGGNLTIPACQGPYPTVVEKRSLFPGKISSEGFGWGTGIPQLSADGESVAFVGTPGEDGDLFLVDMAPGLSRSQAVRQLTRWVDPVPGANNLEVTVFEAKNIPFSGAIEECAISPDGKRVAFTTRRQNFPLAPPTIVSPAPVGPSEVNELYQVDLNGETIERVTPGGAATVSLGPEGPGGAGAPSYDGDGTLLAFASNAFNLVEGDTNEKSDAFVVESPESAPVNPSTISRRPATLVVQPLWRMTVTASSLPDGTVQIAVGLPGAGTLRAKATARVGGHLKRRRVAKRILESAGQGLRKVKLRLAGKLRGLARQRGGLYAQLDLSFVGPGGKPLHAALDARFLVHRKNVKAKGPKR